MLLSVVIKANAPVKAMQTTAAVSHVRPTTTRVSTTTAESTTKVETTTNTVETSATTKRLDVSPNPSKPIIGIYFKPNRVYISQQEFEDICCVVRREAGADYGHVEGCYAVAQCILQGMLHNNISATELLDAYDYNVVDARNRAIKTPPNERTREAVYKVFYEGYGVTPRPIEYYYSPANMENGYSELHESQKFVFCIDGNRFFEKK